MPRYVVRQVREHDLDALVALAEQTTFGLSTLPRDRDMLAQRVRSAVQGFSRIAEQPRGESYLFVLEDADDGIVGTAGIVSKVGGFDPFYAYGIETRIHESRTLGVRKEIRTLHLVREHDGPCEIGSLFLAPDLRSSGIGRFLSLSRFLFMATHSNLFDPVVIAEMRGVVDEQGRSPFWEAVGRHFFDVDFPTADYLSVVDKRFIAELMPEHPIYLPLLPETAREVVGKVHPKTEPAMKLLISEGFEPSGMVDIFDAGPAVTCPLDDIRTVRESEEATVVEFASDELGSGGVDESTRSRGEATSPVPWMIARAEGEFRACLGGIDRPDDSLTIARDGIRISRSAAESLRIKVGNRVRFALLRPQTATGAKPHGAQKE